MLASLAPARRRFVVGVLGLTLVAAVTVAAAVVAERVSRRTPELMPVAQDGQPPVLLVPGYGGATGDLEPLAAALRARGRQAEVVQLAGNGTGDLRTQAHVLEAAVEGVTRGSTEGVDLVGYSAGGVTVRLWLHEYDGGSVARRIVTLGSPHHGTDLASLATDLAPDACPMACRQLTTDSGLLRTLNAGDETPPGPAWVSFWTTDDRISTPPETASLAGALDVPVQQVCPSLGLTHGQLPTSPVVIAMVLSELRRTPPAVPPASVCASR